MATTSYEQLNRLRAVLKEVREVRWVVSDLKIERSEAEDFLGVIDFLQSNLDEVRASVIQNSK